MKKSYFLSLLFALFFVSAQAQDLNCFRVVAETPKPVCNPGELRVLKAAPPIGRVPKETTSYNVAPTTFSWKSPENISDVTSITVDDQWSQLVPLYGKPANSGTLFNFCFYGEKYNKVLVGDNGAVLFSITGDPDTPAGSTTYAPNTFCPYDINTILPNPSQVSPFRNAIMGVLQDLKINTTGRVPTTDISYFTTGTYPCRTFVASFTDMPFYSCNGNVGLQSYQIVLFESTNIVEVHIRNKTICTNWPPSSPGAAIVGMQNATGTSAVFPPNRNGGRWSAQNESWRFTPSGANVPVTYHWYQVDPADINTVIADLGMGQTKNVNPTAESTYRVDALFGTCDPAIPQLPASDVTTIKFGEVAVNNPLDMVHCNSEANANQFNVGDNIAVIYQGSGLSLTTTEAYFYTTLQDAEDGLFNGVVSLNPNDAAAVYTMPVGETSHTLYISITDGLGACTSIIPFKVSIIDCKIDADVCDVDNDDTEDVNLLNFVPLIDASNTADGLDPADYTLTFHNSDADADNIATAIPTTNPFTIVEGQQIFVRVQNIADPTTYIVKYLEINLHPNPDVVISGTATVCAGTTAPITITGHPGSVVNYTLDTVPQPAITIPVGGTVTLTTVPVVASTTYTYEITSATFTDTDGYVCSSPVPQSAAVTGGGLPTAAITTADTAACEGDVVTIDVTGTAGALVEYRDETGALVSFTMPTGGTYSFTTPPMPAAGSYNYTLVKATAGTSCEQALTDTVTITAAPAPVVTLTVLDPQLCVSGTSNTAQVRFDGTPDTTVNYTLNGVPDFVNIPVSGTFTITDTFTAAGTYDYVLVDATSTAAPFCSAPQIGTGTVTVAIGPTATIAAPTGTICSGATTTINFSGTPNASVYYSIAGVAQTTPVVLTPSATNPAVGEGSITTAALTANTTYQLIRVVSAGTPACETLVTDPVTVNVQALPTATISPNQTICSGTSTTVTVTAPANSTVTYTLNGGASTTLTINGSGTGTINTGTLTADAVYRLVSITATVGGVTCSNTLNVSSTVRVTPLPTASFTALPNICSNRTAEITFTGTPNTTVNFTYTVGGAATPDSVLLDGSGSTIYTTIPIVAVTTFDLVTAVSTASGSIPSCTAAIAGQVTITPIAAPVINFAPTPLEVCDDNTDGIAVFNLTDKDVEIVGAGSTLLVSYHETVENAEDNVFPKQLAPYRNLRPASPEDAPYYMYVRVQEVGGSQCPSYTRIRLIVNRTPQAVAPSPITICDDTSADGFAIFPDLKIKEAEMTAALDARDTYAFVYYDTQANAEAGLAAGQIATVSYTNRIAYNDTVWVRVINTSGSTLCYKVVALQLIVNPNPVIPAPGALPEYTMCDYNNPGDEQEVFDLDDYKQYITTAAGMDIKYYFSDADVLTGTELPLQYTNTVTPAQTIVVIVTNTATGCSSRTTLTLRVQELPLITIPAIIPTACDPDNNGAAQFDLDLLIPEITGGAPYTITFHETMENAEDGTFAILYPYSNLASGIIWIRAKDNNSDCYSVAPLQLIVNPVPVVPASGVIPDLVECDTNADRIKRVNLQAHAEPYLLPQPVPGTYDITYYLTEAEADSGTTGAIVPITNYLATDGQTIWVRIENAASGCPNKVSFKIVINPARAFAAREYSVCDDALPNDGFAQFDLASQDALFTAPLTGYTVVYYKNVTDQTNDVPIDKTVPYTNSFIGVENIQVTIIDNVTGCPSSTRLTLRVEPLPNPKTDPADIELCDNGVSNTDGIAENVDLTVRENYIRNNAAPGSVAFYYYNNLALADLDAAANAISNVGFTNAIPTPTNYSGPSGTIYVLMTTNPLLTDPAAVKCSARVQFELIVNPVPELGVAGVIEDFVACLVGSTGSYTFTLSDHNPKVIAPTLNVADYTFAYYDTQANAEAGTALGLLNNSHPNGSNPEPIWVRVENIATGCANVGTFDLIVDEAAVANAVTDPALITKCDTDVLNDGFTEFDLTTLDSTVLGTQTPGDYTVHYYLEESDAILDGAQGVTTTNPLAITDVNSFLSDTQVIWALVINRTSTTGCPDRVAIQLTVNALPKVTLTGGFFCFDPATNLPIGTFDLFADVDPDTGNYTFEWTRNGAPYPVADNTQNPIAIDQEGDYSVVVTNVDTGCISEPAPAVRVEPTSTAVATASVTGYFTDNATITVNVSLSSLGVYEFKLDEGQWQDSNVFTNVATGTHLVYIQDKNPSDCAAFPPLTVNVINYPKYFTPNGDGIHDTWTIAGLGETAKIYIFDRYGKLIKQIASGDNVGDGWNGTMNGQMLPSTDYWFKVEYFENDVLKEFKAHFSLKR